MIVASLLDNFVASGVYNSLKSYNIVKLFFVKFSGDSVSHSKSENSLKFLVRNENNLQLLYTMGCSR